MAAPWEKYQQAAPQQSGGVVVGRPSPIIAAREDRAEAREDRAARAEMRAAEAARLAAENAARDAQLDAKKIAQADKLAEAEAKATNFYNSALGAETEWRSLANDPAKREATESPGLLGEAARAVLPSGLVNTFTSEERQRAQQAKENFIRASLRLESGAAIGKEEFDRQERIFFPQPGEAPETAAQKARARQQIIEGFKIGAGTGAARVEALRGDLPPINPAVTERVQFAGEGPAQMTGVANLTPQQEAAIRAIAQSGADRNAIKAVFAGFGRNIPDEQVDAAVRFYSNPENRNVAPLIVENNAVKPVDPGDGALGAAARGAGDALTLGFLDEAGALADTVTRGGTYDEALNRRRGMAAFDEQNNGGSRLAGQVVGGLGLPSFGATGVGQLARLGAAYGGAYGVGSANGGMGDRAIGGAIGAGTGAALGGLLGAGGQYLAGRGGGPTPPTGGQELMAAAQRQGIDPLPADVGGPMTRRMTAGVVQTPFGAGAIMRAADRVQGQAAARFGAIANAEGAPLRQERLGELAQGISERYIANTSAAGRQAYAGARELSANTQVTPNTALQNIDAQLAELAPTASTDAPLIAGLQRIRADLADGETPRAIPIDAIRRLRTTTRSQAQTDELRVTDYQRRAGEIVDTLAEDIASQLPPAAARAFREADEAWRTRLETIDDVLAEVVGPQGDRSAESVARRVIGMSRGDSARFRRFLDTANPEEAGIIRGSVIQDLGRSLPGQQNAAGSGFSLQTFLTNWDNLPARSRDTLFRGEHRRAIEDLARVAEGVRASRAYANTSGTAGATNASRFVTEGARLGSTAGAISTLGGTVVLENLTGRLLGSTRFAQWLARAPQDPAQRGAWVRRLGAIATREPQIANDILPLQQALQAALPARAAAEDNKNQRRN